jgi:hypothetical protein
MAYPWPQGAALTFTDLNAAFALAYAQAQTAQATASNALALTNTSVITLGPPRPVSVTLNWPAIPVANGTYILSATLPYALTVTSIDAAIGSAGGSIQAQFRANGVTIGNLSGVAVSAPTKTNTLAVAQPSNPVTIGVGSTIDVVVTVTGGTPIDAYLCLNGLRTT